MKPVWISGFNCRLPQAFERVVVSSSRNLHFISGELKPDKNSMYYPARSDEKIMRTDVKAAVVVVGEMLGKQTLGLNHPDLYVANGVFIEDSSTLMDRLAGTYSQIEAAATDREKMVLLYRSTPPLLALQTLTNSTMSFIAQYCGLKGNNATFGNTSHAAFHAIQRAVWRISGGNGGQCVVCASNSGGVHSYLTFSTFFENREDWKESSVAASLLMTSDGAIGICKITCLTEGKNLPELGKRPGRSWADLCRHRDGDISIFSGAYTEKQYVSDRDYCLSFSKTSFSHFPQFGSFGSANLLMSIIKGIEFLQTGHAKVDIFNRDPFGRECHIRLEL